jgi:hypothetical protein
MAAKTHEFVGGRRGVDHSVWCGNALVLTVQAGILPSADGEMAEVTFPCSEPLRDAEGGGPTTLPAVSESRSQHELAADAATGGDRTGLCLAWFVRERRGPLDRVRG